MVYLYSPVAIFALPPSAPMGRGAESFLSLHVALRRDEGVGSSVIATLLVSLAAVFCHLRFLSSPAHMLEELAGVVILMRGECFRRPLLALRLSARPATARTILAERHRRRVCGALATRSKGGLRCERSESPKSPPVGPSLLLLQSGGLV